jgi:hypothetical protein
MPTCPTLEIKMIAKALLETFFDERDDWIRENIHPGSVNDIITRIIREINIRNSENEQAIKENLGIDMGKKRLDTTVDLDDDLISPEYVRQ